MPAAIRIDLCSTAEVAPGNALQVDKAGLVLAVFNQNGELFVTTMPGARPWLAFGRVHRGRGSRVHFHNGQFNIKTGEVVAAPCTIPIKIYKNIVENDRVHRG